MYEVLLCRRFCVFKLLRDSDSAISSNKDSSQSTGSILVVSFRTTLFCVLVATLTLTIDTCSLRSSCCVDCWLSWELFHLYCETNVCPYAFPSGAHNHYIEAVRWKVERKEEFFFTVVVVVNTIIIISPIKRLFCDIFLPVACVCPYWTTHPYRRTA